MTIPLFLCLFLQSNFFYDCFCYKASISKNFSKAVNFCKEVFAFSFENWSIFKGFKDIRNQSVKLKKSIHL